MRITSLVPYFLTLCLAAPPALACGDVYMDVRGVGHVVDVIDNGCGTYLSGSVNGAGNRLLAETTGAYGTQILSQSGTGLQMHSRTGGVGASIAAHQQGHNLSASIVASDGAQVAVVQRGTNSTANVLVNGPNVVRIQQ